MRRAPNIEQLKAIEHHGGVLLEAGAGSGKTFVLSQHIVYLTIYIIVFHSYLSKSYIDIISFSVTI